MRIPTIITSLVTAASTLSAPLALSQQSRDRTLQILEVTTKPWDEASTEKLREWLVVIGREIQKIINEKRTENKISLKNGELAILGALFDHSKKHPNIKLDTITRIAIEIHEISLLTPDNDKRKRHETLMNNINDLLGIPKK